jgi:hypothetical protein
MFQIELSLAIYISADIIAVTLNFPVVTAVAVSMIPECGHLLPASDRTLEI